MVDISLRLNRVYKNNRGSIVLIVSEDKSSGEHVFEDQDGHCYNQKGQFFCLTHHYTEHSIFNIVEEVGLLIMDDELLINTLSNLLEKIGYHGIFNAISSAISHDKNVPVGISVVRFYNALAKTYQKKQT